MKRKLTDVMTELKDKDSEAAKELLEKMEEAMSPPLSWNHHAKLFSERFSHVLMELPLSDGGFASLENCMNLAIKLNEMDREFRKKELGFPLLAKETK